ncbi:hypothetical protein VHEMI06832 [[Torrubiella] hemipterigena]|uniref:Uncharacterized protein n=1 Tax=[Torrubiella] hemipterigena TaxID=1531966 RepID=A0A0A1TK27_9HYPO|nr:hypothetical protein VHEMI06832 [[Torrubiella] hemipterigena]
MPFTLNGPIFTLLLTASLFGSFGFCGSIADDLYHNYFDPAPAPEDGPAFSRGSLRDTRYLPIQIAGIVSAYAVSLIIVALTLLALSGKRRAHLTATDEDEVDLEEYQLSQHFSSPSEFPIEKFGQPGIPNFSLKSPLQQEFGAATSFELPNQQIVPSNAPGINPHVDQSLVEETKEMSQKQLEEMYKHVMEHEEAKEQGIVLESPVYATTSRFSSANQSHLSAVSSKREKTKPANLDLTQPVEAKPASKTSSFLSALRSPKKKNIKALQISSPIMTPQTSVFPHQEYQETNPLSPRHYNPSLRSSDQGSIADSQQNAVGVALPMTPDMSPESVQSIDERLGNQPLSQLNVNNSRTASQVPSEYEPPSATSQHSQAALVGLPASPKPGATFNILPASPRPGATFAPLPLSPKPGATFQRPNAPSAVRTGGTLPLRAYEPALASPTTIAQTTKQTVFERRGPLSPGGGPLTANAVPYSPYQPFTPCMPITPSLVTKEDRKRMKRMVPKTPTLQMVQSSDEMW